MKKQLLLIALISSLLMPVNNAYSMPTFDTIVDGLGHIALTSGAIMVGGYLLYHNLTNICSVLQNKKFKAEFKPTTTHYYFYPTPGTYEVNTPSVEISLDTNNPNEYNYSEQAMQGNAHYYVPLIPGTDDRMFISYRHTDNQADIQYGDGTQITVTPNNNTFPALTPWQKKKEIARSCLTSTLAATAISYVLLKTYQFFKR